MNIFYKKSLSWKLSLIITSVVIPLLMTLILSTYFIIRETTISNIKNETKLKANAISANINSFFSNSEAIMTFLASNEQIHEYLKEVNDRKKITHNPKFSAIMRTLRQTCNSNKLFNSVWVANVKGSFYFESGGFITDSNYIITKRPWFEKASTTKAVSFSYPYIDYTTNFLVISPIAPIIDNNTITGFVGADLFITDISAVFRGYKIGEKGENFLIAPNGSFIYHDDPGKSIRMNIFDEAGGIKSIAKEIIDKKNGFREIEYKGEQYYLSYTLTSGKEWIIGSLINKSEAFSSLNRKTFLLIIISLAIIFVLISLSYKSINALLKPLAEIKYFANEIANGDITKDLDQSLIRREDEIGEMSKSFAMITESFRRQNSSLEEKIKEKSLQIEMQFKYILESEKAVTMGNVLDQVAKEVSSPLSLSSQIASSIEQISEANIEKLKEGKISHEDFQSFIEKIYDSAKILNSNLGKTSQIMSSLSESTEAKNEKEKQIFSVKESILSSISSILKEHKSSLHQFHIECDDHFFIESYPGLFALLFTNLISNSFKHGFISKRSGNIFIDVTQSGGVLKIVYQDDGEGIAEENIAKIYEPFFSTTKQSGSKGLGMNIIFNIVTKTLKGEIICDSSPGKGVKFTITVPLKKEKE